MPPLFASQFRMRRGYTPNFQMLAVSNVQNSEASLVAEGDAFTGVLVHISPPIQPVILLVR